MKNISAAFVKAKRAFGPALKCKTNPAFKSKYADLAACLEAVDEALLDNGIALIQETFEDATGITVETVFMHESGETLRCGKLHVPASKQDPQGYGSALSYARRYSLMASCGIAAEDDDGNAASKKPEQKKVGLSESAIADHLAAIESAASGKELKAAFDIAYDAAQGNEALQDKFTAAAEAKRAKALAKSNASQG